MEIDLDGILLILVQFSDFLFGWLSVDFVGHMEIKNSSIVRVLE